MKIRYLLDENIPPRIALGPRRLSSQLDVLCVGDLDAPAFETKDPEILRYCDINQRLLVTKDRTSMPGHLEDYWADGGHLWGVLWVRPRTPTGLLIQELHFVWEASEAEEWFDAIDWIPF